LHGCAVLEQYIKQGDYGKVCERDQGGERSDEKVEKRRQEAGEEKLGALGLGEDEERFIEAMVLYLQGWSLHHLGELFEEIKGAAVKLGNKKRKIDLNEPRTKREWLEAGHFKYKMIHDGLARSWDDGESEDLMMTLVGADIIHCKCSLAKCMIEAGEREEGLKLAHELRWAQSDRIESSYWGLGTKLDYFDDGDAVLAQLRSWTQCIAFREECPSDDREGWEHKLVETTKDSDKDIRAFEITVDELNNEDLDGSMGIENDGREKGEERKAQIQLWKWLKRVVIADAKMAKFVMLEDALEAKYRPEDEEDEEDDDEEVEVKELPMDAEDVKLVKKASQEGESFSSSIRSSTDS